MEAFWEKNNIEIIITQSVPLKMSWETKGNPAGKR